MSMHQITPAVGAIIAICVVVYICELATNGKIIQKYSFDPSRVRSSPIRWVTSMFMHAMTPLHILFNMFALYNVGPSLEKYLGAGLFLLVYFGAGFGGNFVYYIWAKSRGSRSTAVGASGAIYGLIGALGVVIYFSGGNMSYLTSSFVSMVIWSFASRGIAWQAHLGGFIAGAGMMYLLMVV